MKPLSALNYCKYNKKKLFTSIISIVVAVAFLFVLQNFVKSMSDSMFQIFTNPYNTHMELYSNEENKPISEAVVTMLENNINVEKVIPYTSFNTKFILPGTISAVPIYSIKSEDMKYVMSKHKAVLKEGHLPSDGSNEIALDSKIVKNKKIKLGDKIGNSIDKNDSLVGEYVIVGILEGSDYISLMSSNTSSPKASTFHMEKALLVFPKENKNKEVDKLLASLPKDEVKARAVTLSFVQKKFNESTSILHTLDMICVLAILVMVISVGSSKYVQFFNRKQELGVLNAMGYTKTQIMKRAFIEVAMINLSGFIIGMCLGTLCSVLINNGAFKAAGALARYSSSKAFIVSLYIPIFTTLFTLVPVNRMISKLDPITMIEQI